MEGRLQRIKEDTTFFPSFPYQTAKLVLTVPDWYPITPSPSEGQITHLHLPTLTFGAGITGAVTTAILTDIILISCLKWRLLHFLVLCQTDHGSSVCLTSLLAELNELEQKS